MLFRSEPGDRRDLAILGAIDEVRRASERAAALTRQLVAFGRQEVEKLEVIDLNRVVGDLVRMLERLIGEHISLVTVASPSPATVKVDPGQLNQILMNLVVNAGDAMPEGGRVSLSVAREVDGREPHVVLRVTDDGDGMDAETASRV